MQVGDSGPIARHIIPYDTTANETIFALQHVIDVIELKLVLLCHSIVSASHSFPLAQLRQLVRACGCAAWFR
jgi:hypothetical protein